MTWTHFFLSWAALGVVECVIWALWRRHERRMGLRGPFDRPTTIPPARGDDVPDVVVPKHVRLPRVGAGLYTVDDWTFREDPSTGRIRVGTVTSVEEGGMVSVRIHCDEEKPS